MLGLEFRPASSGTAWVGERPEPPKGGTPNGGNVRIRPDKDVALTARQADFILSLVTPAATGNGRDGLGGDELKS